MRKYINDSIGEKSFEIDLARAVAVFGGKYYKRRDTIIDKSQRNKLKYGKSNYSDVMGKDFKRPFDGLLCLPSGNFTVELKYNNNSLEKHQKDAIRKVGKINGFSFALRKRVYCQTEEKVKIQTEYSIESYINGKKKILVKTDKMNDIFLWFMGKIGEDEDHINYHIKQGEIVGKDS